MFNGIESASLYTRRDAIFYSTGKTILTVVVAGLITLGASTALGVTVGEDWFPEWVGDEDYEDGYFYYPSAITCSERDERSESRAKLNDGGTLKVGKTNAKGITKFTCTYKDAQGRKQTVSWSGHDINFKTFASKGHVYEFGWDAYPYMALLFVDPVYDSNDNMLEYASIHFYVIDVQKSGNVAVPVEWQKARTLTGLYGEGCFESAEGAEGTAQLKCGKANKKGIAKVSLSIMPFNGKKRSYKSVAVDVSKGGSVEVSWPQQKYQVAIDGDEFFGEPIYGDGRPSCSPNAVWSANVGGAMTGEYFIKFPEWGGWDNDWQYDGGFNVFMEVAAAKLWHQYGEYGYCPNSSSILFRGGYFMVSGKKWDFSSQFDDETRPKITYNSKTGLFTGSVYLMIGPYCGEAEGVMPRYKKVTLKIKGVYADGVISGAVTYKQFSTPVTGGSASRR